MQRDLEQGHSEVGGLLADAPDCVSVQELLDLAGHRELWRQAVRELLPLSDPSRRQRSSGGKGSEGRSDAWMLASGHYLEDGVWKLEIRT